MALVYTDLDKIAGGAPFLARVKSALSIFARDVEDEVTTTALHPDRLALANRFSADPGNMTSKLAVRVASDAAIIAGTLIGTSQPTWDSSISDATLYGIVNARWNKWFGLI